MGWYSYEDAGERRGEVLRKIQARRDKGETFEPVVAGAGRAKLSTTFWGQAWCRQLEAHSDYASRLPRGRSYLRQGNVYNLEIGPGRVHACVAGAELYDTDLTILPMPGGEWQSLVAQCGGQIGSMLDLLAGRLGDDTMRVLTHPEQGLFPKPRQISFRCSCPDWADMCKHVAAVLYAVGVMLDGDPGLLFVLRGVDQNELIGDARAQALGGLASAADGAGELDGADLSALFGIALADGDGSNPAG